VQWGIPNITLQHGLSGFGNGSEGPYENNNRSLQFIDNLSWVRGKHTLKFGGEVRRDVYRQIGNQFARGQFSFNRNATRNPGVTGTTGDALPTSCSTALSVRGRRLHRQSRFPRHDLLFLR